MELIEKLDKFFNIIKNDTKTDLYTLSQPMLNLTYRIKLVDGNVIWDKRGLVDATYDIPQQIFLNRIKTDIMSSLDYRIERIVERVKDHMYLNKSTKCKVNCNIIDTPNLVDDMLDNGKTRLSFVINPYTRNWFYIKKYLKPYWFIINIAKDSVVIETHEPDPKTPTISATAYSLYDIDNIIWSLIEMKTSGE